MGRVSPIPPGHSAEATPGDLVIRSRSDAQKGLKCHQIGQQTEKRLDVVHFGRQQFVRDSYHLRSLPGNTALFARGDMA
jgi:hypothetical protein